MLALSGHCDGKVPIPGEVYGRGEPMDGSWVCALNGVTHGEDLTRCAAGLYFRPGVAGRRIAKPPKHGGGDESYGSKLTAFDSGCFACMLGGADKRTLCLIANEGNEPASNPP